jgi:hypothetical protein
MSTSSRGEYCYGCVGEENLEQTVVDGKDVLLCASCDPDRDPAEAQ